MEYIDCKENVCNNVSIDEINQVDDLSDNKGCLNFTEEDNFIEEVKDFTNLCLNDPGILNYNFTHTFSGNSNSFYNVISEQRSHTVPDSIFTYHKSEKFTYGEIHNDNYSCNGYYKQETDLSLYSNSHMTLLSSSSEYLCNSLSPSSEYVCNSLSSTSEYLSNSLSSSSEYLCNSLSPSSEYSCNTHSSIAQECLSLNTMLIGVNNSTSSTKQSSEESHRKCLEPLTSVPLTVGARSSMWEWPPQSDPVLEKRRQRAIKAHNKRERARRKNKPE